MKSSSRLDSAVFQLTPSDKTNMLWTYRFVRFVSNPEVLERVYALESEILQIEEAIAIQSNNEIGLAMVKDHQTKSVEHIDGSRPLLDSNEEKAIVLYKVGAHLIILIQWLLTVRELLKHLE
ncbi:hypothetical protein GH714_005155 [Hevea brasiliensis]|uniref:Uncharacterized protein n=1 Tax=Hevea brasiliensis TaxID=3981 RepID=A0A6A6K9N2_HEVBR|nr:hypothetical protein GH714_005155 [Hevea brasiliensis]